MARDPVVTLAFDAAKYEAAVVDMRPALEAVLAAVRKHVAGKHERDLIADRVQDVLQAFIVAMVHETITQAPPGFRADW